MYFKNIPTIIYDSVGNGEFKDVKNLLRRVAIRAKVKTNTLLYDTYDVKEGEFLAILNSGAYGSSMSSNYNARPLVSEILINEDNFTTIRKLQSFEDSIAQEIK